MRHWPRDIGPGAFFCLSQVMLHVAFFGATGQIGALPLAIDTRVLLDMPAKALKKIQDSGEIFTDTG